MKPILTQYRNVRSFWIDRWCVSKMCPKYHLVFIVLLIWLWYEEGKKLSQVGVHKQRTQYISSHYLSNYILILTHCWESVAKAGLDCLCPNWVAAQGWIVSPQELFLTGGVSAPVARLQQRLSHCAAEGFIKDCLCLCSWGSAVVWQWRTPHL